MSKRRKHLFKTTISFLLLLFGAAVLLFVFWCIPLFDRLERLAARRETRRPAQFLADMRILRPGDTLSLPALARALDRRGYSAWCPSPTKTGEYCLDDSAGRLILAQRNFAYPDGTFFGGIYEIKLRENRVEEIYSRAENSSVPEWRLEPMEMDFFARGVEQSRWVALEDTPEILRDALLLSEDRRFYSHHGLDPRSLARAIWVNVRRAGVRQGGSTLTQQLAKNAFLTPERRIWRKLKEAFLAVALEIRYPKERVLEMYLNQIYLGREGTRGLYGIDEAARAYFGKPAPALALGESALLVGIIPAPNAYSPRLHPDLAIKRRNRVLDLLRAHDKITLDEWRGASSAALELSTGTPGMTGLYFADWARRLLEEKFPGPQLETDGYRIFLTMNADMQKAAEESVAAQKLEGALVAIDPRDGQVRAMAGGRDFYTSPFNRATLAHRQPGSAFKPILFAAALESRAVTAATVLEDKPLRLEQRGKLWEPQNYDGKFRGTSTVREALVYSLNIPSVHVLEKTGAENVVRFAQALNIKSPLLAVPSLALGTSEVSPLELTAAYAAFANGGNAVEPSFIRWVTDAEGYILWEQAPVPRPAFSPGVASIVTSLLEDVINVGTGRSARALGLTGAAAGKTGTTDNFSDVWFVGYTPDLVCGVWLGKDKPASLGMASSRLALPVWVDFMKAAVVPSVEFPKNPDVERVKIDPSTGQSARIGCPDSREELFLPGTAPESCATHRGGVPGMFDKLFKWFKS